MIHYSAQSLTAKQHYKFLTGSIMPRPIAWLTTRDLTSGIVNAAPFSYFNVVAKEPPLVSISINRRAGQMKDSARNLSSNGEAVIHLVDDQVLAAMNATAASLPASESELRDSGLTLLASRSVAVPAIAEAPIRLEARHHQYLPVTDGQGKIVSDLFILEILDYYFVERIFDQEKQYISAEAFAPVSRLAGNAYGHLADISELPRPE